ncbi:hypothetical protein [Streptomyces hilarionis]|uniref:hypothetical protein n=1 Tax=Streptomyces hilarionis TaxID=2839954 RepID=UPI00211A5F53|nr:hypothetical protein [Streptomyces hilarionis]
MPKAYVFTRYGRPETEALVDAERTRPGPGQVLVAVRAAGASRVDRNPRTGLRRESGRDARAFPAAPGGGASDALGGLARGEAVLGIGAGA